MSYKAVVLADSISELGHRLITVEVTFPRFILAEVNTHRVFSRNSASSRAIPPERLIERVIEDPFIPETFNKRVKGMGVGEQLTGSAQIQSEASWLRARDMAVIYAKELITFNVDKSRVNRLLEPFLWHTAIISSTEWDNFFALRDHPDAQPEFQITAGVMLDAMRASNPELVNNDEWHLPLITPSERGACEEEAINWEYMAMVSAGRCARVSFDKHGEYEPIADSHARARKLKESGHLSPFEHPATPVSTDKGNGNFRGWKQLRKTIPYEENLVGHKEGRPAWDQ